MNGVKRAKKKTYFHLAKISGWLAGGRAASC